MEELHLGDPSQVSDGCIVLYLDIYLSFSKSMFYSDRHTVVKQEEDHHELPI